MIKCPNCGAVYNDNTWFCVNCSTVLDPERDRIVEDLEEAVPEVDAEENKDSIVEEEPEKKKSGESSTAQESVTTANRLYNTNVEMSLYYFDPSKNKANSQKASGTSSSSSAASGSSAASA